MSPSHFASYGLVETACGYAERKEKSLRTALARGDHLWNAAAVRRDVESRLPSFGAEGFLAFATAGQEGGGGCHGSYDTHDR